MPEHTLAAYALAMKQGADFIEPDLVITRDGVLVARHENELSSTTDVSERAEFGTRRTRKRIDGKTVEGWFSEDFTLAELKTLRTCEPLPGMRPGSAKFDGCFEIPTLQETIDLLAAGDRRHGASMPPDVSAATQHIGLYPELKHSTYYSAIGFDTLRLLLETLESSGLSGYRDRVFIQSFETSTLKELRRMTDLPLVQLLDTMGRPRDLELAGDRRTYRDLAMPAGLAEIATYADAIGPAKDLVVPRSVDGFLDQPSDLVEEAHRVELLVHAWTFRSEDAFLPGDFRGDRQQPSPGDAVAKGPEGEIAHFLAAGLDGVFTDNPDIGVRARDAFFYA